MNSNNMQSLRQFARTCASGLLAVALAVYLLTGIVLAGAGLPLGWLLADALLAAPLGPALPLVDKALAIVVVFATGAVWFVVYVSAHLAFGPFLGESNQ